jgi:hypothetical protein
LTQAVLLINGCCVISKKIEFFRNLASLIRKTEEGKTSKEGNDRKPERISSLVKKNRGSKEKGSPQRVSLFGGFFYSNPNS